MDMTAEKDQLEDKSPSTPTPITENFSLQASQIIPGEELFGEEEYYQERRERNLPNVSTISKTDKVGQWLGDTASGEYMDLASQHNPSQISVSTPLRRSFLPPRIELAEVVRNSLPRTTSPTVCSVLVCAVERRSLTRCSVHCVVSALTGTKVQLKRFDLTLAVAQIKI